MKTKDRKAIKNVFYISRKSLAFVIFSLVVLVIAYVVLQFLEKKADAEYMITLLETVRGGEDLSIPDKRSVVLPAFESGIFALITITITYLISNLAIDKKSKNEIYAEAFSDMCNNQSMELEINSYGKISYELKSKLKERHIPKEMMNFSIGKIMIPEKEFYYRDCNIDIVCSIKNGFFEKTITKKTVISSYDSKYTFLGNDRSSSYCIAKYCGGICDRDPITIEHFFINNKELPNDCCSVDGTGVFESLSNKQGYKKAYTAYYNRDFTITQQGETKVVVDYTTIAPLDDSVYVFRLPCACKKLHLTYRLNDMPNYKLCGHAFGFFDDAISSHNTDTKNILQFDFENWVFQRDGISISMIPVQTDIKS